MLTRTNDASRPDPRPACPESSCRSPDDQSGGGSLSETCRTRRRYQRLGPDAASHPR